MRARASMSRCSWPRTRACGALAGLSPKKGPFLWERPLIFVNLWTSLADIIAPLAVLPMQNRCAKTIVGISVRNLPHARARPFFLPIVKEKCRESLFRDSRRLGPFRPVLFFLAPRPPGRARRRKDLENRIPRPLGAAGRHRPYRMVPRGGGDPAEQTSEPVISLWIRRSAGHRPGRTGRSLKDRSGALRPRRLNGEFDPGSG